MIHDNNINKNDNIDTTKQIQILTSDTNISKNNSMTITTKYRLPLQHLYQNQLIALKMKILSK